MFICAYQTFFVNRSVELNDRCVFFVLTICQTTMEIILHFSFINMVIIIFMGIAGLLWKMMKVERMTQIN